MTGPQIKETTMKVDKKTIRPEDNKMTNRQDSTSAKGQQDNLRRSYFQFGPMPGRLVVVRWC